MEYIATLAARKEESKVIKVILKVFIIEQFIVRPVLGPGQEVTRCSDTVGTNVELVNSIGVTCTHNIFGLKLELETKAIRWFPKVSIVSYSRPSLMIIVSATQFHVNLRWGQRLFSIVS